MTDEKSHYEIASELVRRYSKQVSNPTNWADHSPKSWEAPNVEVEIALMQASAALALLDVIKEGVKDG